MLNISGLTGARLNRSKSERGTRRVESAPSVADFFSKHAGKIATKKPFNFCAFSWLFPILNTASEYTLISTWKRQPRGVNCRHSGGSRLIFSASWRSRRACPRLLSTSRHISARAALVSALAVGLQLV
jgi:hypothetical protein